MTINKTRKVTKRRRKSPHNRSKYNVERLDVTYTSPDGTTKHLPALIDAVDELFAFNTRGQIIQQLRPLYGCSEDVIDQAIARCKDASWEYARANRAERLRRNLARLRAIATKATREKNFQAARGAIADESKLAGDYKVRVQIEENSKPIEDLTDEQLLAAITASRNQRGGSGKGS